MIISQSIRRFLFGIVPVFIIFIITIVQAVSVIADEGQNPRVGVVKNRSAARGPGLITQDLSTGLTPTELAQALVGPGITVTNVTYSGALTATGTFSGGTGIIGFDNGIILSSGNMNDIVGPNQTNATTTEQFTPGDSDLDILAGSPTFDAAVLEFDFVPDDSQIFFQFVFASEEYNEFVFLGFNDVFGFFINGVNCATVTALPISIDTINLILNPALYRNNDIAIGSPINTEADGLTVVLTCNAAVNPGITNHMKLAIADASDLAWDSWVFLKGTSLTTDISINLGPNPGQACQGTPHTMIAIIADTPQENIPVSFEIVSGPNTGLMGNALTNGDGIATFVYTSTGTLPAVDVAQASFVGSDGQIYFSEGVPIFWDLCIPPTPTPTATPTATGTVTTTPTATPTVTVTATPEPVNCTYAIGYWKERPDEWPTDSLTLGGITYDETMLLELLNTPPEGDASYILIYQLIGTTFNVLNGADSSAIATTLVEANTWLVDNPLGSDPSGAARRVGIALARILDDYNRGIIGPGYCQQPPPSCTNPMLYGVHDGPSDDSQFFDLDLWFGLLSPLGPPHPNADFESMDIHPHTGEMYAIAGGGGNIDGQAYHVDKLTGELTFLGETGVVGSDEIVDMAFHPDGTLWAFQENVGLLTVEITGDLSINHIWDPKTADLDSDWEGLAWDRFGNYLYASEDRNLYRWDPVTQTATRLCGKNFLPGETEALDFRDDGALVGGWHNAPDKHFTLFEIDYEACTILETDYNIRYDDIEALAFDACIPQGSIGGYVLNELGLPLVGAEVRLMAAGPNRILESVPLFATRLSTDQDDIVTVQRTDANGRYQFSQLPADLYAVVLGKVSAGEKVKTGSFPYTVQLAPGENYEHPDAPTAVKSQQGSNFAAGSLATSLIFLLLAGATVRKQQSGPSNL